MSNSKYTFKNILVISVWILLGAGTVVLLVAAITKKNSEKVTGVQINITGVQNNYFIDKKDVINILEKINGKKIDKVAISSLDLSAMENVLKKDQWVKNAEIFFDNNNVLQVKIAEREPIARIFTLSGVSFYIDSSLTRLPLSDKFSARLPVFTSFPTEVIILKKQDSVLLNGVKTLSEYIDAHPFWMAQIDQIDITPAGTFVLTPKLGNQLIRFGTADNCDEKFNKLLAFYKQVQTKIGWNNYSVVDVQFKNQVIGVNRNAAEIKSDSLRTIQIMKSIIEEAQKNINDSTKIQLPQPTDDNNDKVNNSPVLGNVPDETTVEAKIQGQKSSENKVITVTPIHDPEKPFVKNNLPTESKSVIRQPSSNEKPNPTPLKKQALEKGVGKKEVKKGVKNEVKSEVKKPADETKQVPKAVMPPKSDY